MSAISSACQRLLAELSATKTLTCAQLVSLLGNQSLGLAITLFALPSALPISVIPGFSFIFGLPLWFISLQLIMAYPKLWLPQSLQRQTFSASKLQHMIGQALPYLYKMEAWLKPRFKLLTSAYWQRLHGLLLLCLSTLLMLPIPFSNFIFSSLIIFLGLGITNEDGVFIFIAYLGSIIYLSLLFLLTSHLTHYLISWF